MALGVTVALAAGIGNPSDRGATPRVALAEGEFAITNSRSNEAIFVADDVAPGSSAGGQATIANRGDVAGPITLAKSDVVDEPGSGGGRLTDMASITVTDVTRPADPDIVYAGGVADMPEIALGSFAPGEARIYGFTVSLPADGPGSEDVNAYQSSSLRVGYTWSGSAAAPPQAPPPQAAPPPSQEAASSSPAATRPSPSDRPSSSPDAFPSSSPETPSSPRDAGPQPSAQVPPAPGRVSPPSGTPAQRARGDRHRTRKGRAKNRGSAGSVRRGGSDAIAGDPKQSDLTALLDAIKRAMIAAAKKGAFPFLLLLLLGGFFYVQHWLDRRDPKLALAPVDPEPTRTFG